MELHYVRSSLFGTFKLCNFRAYLEYSLGLPQPCGKAAALGTCFHKVFEFLAHRKLCEQTNKTSFFDDGLNQLFHAAEITPEFALDIAFDYYSKVEKHLDWSDADKRDLGRLVKKALAEFNPLDQNIFEVEKFYDLEIGDFRIKGTVDLITKVDDGVLCYTDYKTSKAMRDWATNTDKDFKALCKDFQLSLYYYALSCLYPDYELLMSIFYVKLAPPIFVPFDKSDLPRIEQEIIAFAEEVRKTTVPAAIYPDFRCKWCEYSKHYMSNGDTVCKYLHNMVKRKGIDYVTEKYKRSTAGSYSGGGRDAKIPLKQV